MAGRQAGTGHYGVRDRGEAQGTMAARQAQDIAPRQAGRHRTLMCVCVAGRHAHDTILSFIKKIITHIENDKQAGRHTNTHTYTYTLTRTLETFFLPDDTLDTKPPAPPACSPALRLCRDWARVCTHTRTDTRHSQIMYSYSMAVYIVCHLFMYVCMRTHTFHTCIYSYYLYHVCMYAYVYTRTLCVCVCVCVCVLCLPFTCILLRLGPYANTTTTHPTPVQTHLPTHPPTHPASLGL